MPESRSRLRIGTILAGDTAPEFTERPGTFPAEGGRAPSGARDSSPFPVRQTAPSPATGDGAVPKKPRGHRKPGAPTETQFQKAVTGLCDWRGVWWYHASQPLRDHPGFPDLILVGNRRTIFRELKKAGEKPTAEQVDVGMRLERSGEDWAVWCPADWDSGRIQREIEAIR
jgi:hypothetical protein